jgi:hypothetical protein
MKVLVTLCILGFYLCLCSYGQTTQTGSAKASGNCAVSHSGNYDTITIQNCGIGEEQGKKIIDLLNAVFAKQNHDDQNAKLDELLVIAKRIANPYGSVVTYYPNGTRRTVTQSTGSIVVDDGATADCKLLEEKEKTHDWQGLIDVAQNAITKYPGWFTP